MTDQVVVENLSKKYGTSTVISPVSFRLSSEKIYVLTGANGSGKTTLLTCLSGLTDIDHGVIKVCGYELFKDEVEVRRRMVFVPDVPRFYTELTAWEHLLLIAQANQVNQSFYQKTESLLSRFQIIQHKNLYPHHYSRGMRLKLGIIMALIRPFKVLLMDEPTSALDQESIGVLYEELLQKKEEGATILISSHEPSVTEKLNGTILTINHGILEL